MDAFSYLSVLLSIVLGLALTQILQGFGKLIGSRDRVRFFWPALAIDVVLLVIFVQTWWAMFGLRNHKAWTFGEFAIVLLQTTVLYLIAAVAVPELPQQGPVDMRATYFDHRRWLFGLMFVAGVVSLAKDLVIDGSLPERANVAFHGVFLGLAIAAMLTRREWFHKANALFLLAAFTGYIAALFRTLH